MKNLLRAGGALLALMLLAATLVLVFGSLVRPRGQPAAMAPTPPALLSAQATAPLLTNPVISPTLPSTPAPGPPNVLDPALSPLPAGPTPTPGTQSATPTPLPATGAPRISEHQAIEKALGFARRPGNQLNEAVPPRATLTAAREINRIVGIPRPPTTSEREVWIVAFEGSFRVLTGPPAAPPGYRAVPPLYAKLYVVIDAATGEVTSVHEMEELQRGGRVPE